MMDSPAHSTDVAEADEDSAAGIYGIARQCLVRANYDRPAAIALLLKECADDSDLTAAAVRIACTQLIYHSCFAQRASLKLESKREAAADPADDMRAMQDSWLETYILPNGLALGDAKHADLQHAIAQHLKDELGNRRSRRFIEAIDKQLPANAQVRQKFSSTQLKRLYKATK